MFEDLEEDGPDATPDSPDRVIAWAIATRSESASITAEEAWAILLERYPDEPRFLLLSAYSELNERRRESQAKIPIGGSTAIAPSYLSTKVERIVAIAAEALHPHVRDLLTFAAAVIAAATDEEKDKFRLLKHRVGVAVDEPEPKRDDRDRAGIRLRRFEREVLKELDERTADNQPLGVRAAGVESASPQDEWAAAVADQTKPRRKYAASERFARGELVDHPKFGVGIVTGTEPGKAVILFEAGTRKLVAGS